MLFISSATAAPLSASNLFHIGLKSAGLAFRCMDVAFLQLRLRQHLPDPSAVRRWHDNPAGAHFPPTIRDVSGCWIGHPSIVADVEAARSLTSTTPRIERRRRTHGRCIPTRKVAGRMRLHPDREAVRNQSPAPSTCEACISALLIRDCLTSRLRVRRLRQQRQRRPTNPDGDHAHWPSPAARLRPRN